MGDESKVKVTTVSGNSENYPIMLAETSGTGSFNSSVIDREGNTSLHVAVKEYICKWKQFHVDGCKHENKEKDSNSLKKQNKRLKQLYETVKVLIGKGTAVHIRDNKGKTPLHYAVENESLLELFINAGNYINMDDCGKDTPLHEAVKHSNFNSVKLLLEAGADINASGYKRYRPLHLAISEEGQRNIIEILIENGADINTKNSEASSPLHIAVCLHSLEYVGLLLQAGANVNAATDFGNTPLLMGAKHRAPLTIMDLLIKSKADIKKRDAYGNTALHEAVLHGNHDLVKILLEAGADISGRNDLGNTPLHLSIEKNVPVNILKLLISRKADLNRKDSRGCSPLHKAVVNGNHESVKCLLEAGANINVQNARGYTPLHFGVVKSIPLSMMELLVSNNADVNVGDYDSNSVLFDILRCGKLESVELLLQAGADINAQNKCGDTALHQCITGIVTPMNVMKLLIENNANVNVKNSVGNTALHEAVRLDKLECVRLLVQAGADVNEQNKQGHTALREGINRTVQLDIIEMLIENRADVNIKDFHDCSPLHKAILTDDKKIVKLLLDAGADVNAQDHQGDTPVHVGIIEIVMMDVMELLFEVANLNIQNNKGDTALHLAVRKNYLRIVQMLLFYNADTSITNNDGNTPLIMSFNLQKISLNLKYLLIKYESGNRVTVEGESVLYLSMMTSIGFGYDVLKEGQDVFLCGDVSKVDSNPFTKPDFLHPYTAHLDMFEVVCDAVNFEKETNAQFNSLLACVCARGDRDNHTNLLYLLENQSLMQYVNEIYCFDSQRDILSFILKYTSSEFSREQASELIHLVLSLGYRPDEAEVYKAFSVFSNNRLFQLLLEMELRPKEVVGNFILPHVLLDVSVPVNQSIDLAILKYSHEDQLSYADMLLNMQTIARFCTNLKLWEFFKQYLKESGLPVDRKLGAIFQRRVPSLLELSRNEFRRHSCNKFKLQSYYQFYGFVQSLAIPDIIKEIIRFIFPIYNY